MSINRRTLYDAVTLQNSKIEPYKSVFNRLKLVDNYHKGLEAVKDGTYTEQKRNLAGRSFMS